VSAEQEKEKQAQHFKQDKRQKRDGKGACSIGYNLTNQAFGHETRAATGEQ
jgi:hypothetical protein